MKNTERKGPRKMSYDFMTNDYCIFNRLEQRFHDCEKCPRNDTYESDPDEVFEIEREEKLYG